MATVQGITLLDGQEYDFYGKQFYGTCSTTATTQTKAVTIAGFDNSMLVEGARVSVFFTNQQSYNGQPKLNVSGTGAKNISLGNGTAGYMEWPAGAAIDFVYHSNIWYVVGGNHANTYYWGRAKLSSTIGNDNTTALTPGAVYSAGYVDAAGAAAAAPVQSVNGQTGTVSLTIPTVPTNVSSFNNDAGYLTLATLPIYDGGVSE